MILNLDNTPSAIYTNHEGRKGIAREMYSVVLIIVSNLSTGQLSDKVLKIDPAKNN